MTQSFDSYLRDLLGIKDLQASLAAVAGDVQTTRNIVTQILQKEGQIMSQIDDLNQVVSQIGTAVDAVAAEVQTLEQNVPPNLQPNIDALKTKLAELQSALPNPTP